MKNSKTADFKHRLNRQKAAVSDSVRLGISIKLHSSALLLKATGGGFQ